MPRSMLGHGLVSTSSPPLPLPTCAPSSSTTSTAMPGTGTCALPGLVSVTPGRAEIMIAPVSVCHHVSTIGAVLPPMILRYHIHASGLMGSPTEPSRRIDDRSNFFGISRPSFMNERIAVGAV